MQILPAFTAPIEPSPATRLQWWHRVSKILIASDEGLPWVLAMDANVRVGDSCSSSIGPHQPDSSDEVSEVMHDLLQRIQVYLPSTFAHIMQGPGGTLMQKRNQQFDRSDFLGLPLRWAEQQQMAWVEPAISVGHRCVDHLAVVVEISVMEAGPQPETGVTWSIDAEAIRKAENQERIREIISSAPAWSWEVNVHEHVARVVKYLQTSLAEAFPGEPRRRKASFLTPETKGVHKVVSVTRSKLRQKVWALKLARTRCAFDAWHAGGTGPAYLERLHCRWLSQLHLGIALDISRIRVFGDVLRKSCRQDKAAYIDALAQQLRDAPANEIHTAFKSLVRPSKKLCGKNVPLPRLQKLDGSYCKDFAEIQDRWREHFSMLEAGVPSSPRDLVTHCFAGQVARGSMLSLPGSKVPSLLDLSEAMRSTAGRKAAGQDRLPPSLCQKFGNELAILWFPVMLKTLVHSAEAIGLKGATLCRIPKPTGCRTTCLSHRAVVVQSCLAKVMHRALRHLLVDKLDSIAHPLVFGGRAGQSSCFGAVLARSFVRYAKSAGVSASIVFCDLASAYYGVIRELLVGSDSQSPSLQEICASLSLTNEDLQLMARVAADEPVLDGQDVFLQRVVQEAGHFTWFLMAQDHQPVHTRRGTRPGGPIADLLFGILFVRTLQRRRVDEVHEHTPRFP